MDLWRAFNLFWRLFIFSSVIGIFALTLSGVEFDWATAMMGGFTLAVVVTLVVEGIRYFRRSRASSGSNLT